MKNPESKKNIDPLKNEHLKEGVRPITACVGTQKDLGVWKSSRINEKNGDIEEQNKTLNITDVNYYAEEEGLISKNFKVLEGKDAKVYVISPVDTTSKTSRGYANCTGLVVVGLEKETGENISFLSHQNPNEFFRNKDDFYALIKALERQIIELKERSEEGTIDVVVVGGNYFIEEGISRTDYMKSIELLSFVVKENLGFEPVVMTGPKTSDSSNAWEHIFFDTKNRRLYIERSDVGDLTTEPYLPRDIEKQKDGWN